MSEIMVGKVQVDSRKEEILSGNEIIRVQILNPDGSVKETAMDIQVPVGKTFTGSIVAYGLLTDNA